MLLHRFGESSAVDSPVIGNCHHALFSYLNDDVLELGVSDFLEFGKCLVELFESAFLF